MIFDTLEDAIDYANTRRAISFGASHGARHYCVYLDTRENMHVATHVDLPYIKHFDRVIWSTRAEVGATGYRGRPKALTRQQEDELRRMRSEGWTYAKLGAYFGVTGMTAFRICNRR